MYNIYIYIYNNLSISLFLYLSIYLIICALLQHRAFAGERGMINSECVSVWEG